MFLTNLCNVQSYFNFSILSICVRRAHFLLANTVVVVVVVVVGIINRVQEDNNCARAQPTSL
jgi:hypothetical protein